MKIYEIEGRLRRLGLIDEEIGIISERRYIFVVESKEEIELVDYIEEALGRGIEVWKDTLGTRVINIDKNHFVTWKGLLIEFVIEKAEDDVWIRALIKRYLYNRR